MPAPARCLLVVPDWSVSPETGTGQRTGIFFSALQRLGPTEVMVIGPQLRPGAADRCFPGNARLHFVTEPSPSRALAGWQLLRDRLRRYLMFWTLYRPKPAAQAMVEARIAAGTEIIVYRYFQTFCWARPRNLDDPDRILQFVDIDDRDDQKLQIAVKEFLPSPALAGAYARLMLPFLVRLMRRRLAGVARIWFSATEDTSQFSGIPASAIPNVPFTTPRQSVAQPSTQKDLLFLGGGSYGPNRVGVRWFLQSCWPTIRARHPESRFRVVGPGDWQSLAAEFPDADGVDFVGRVESVEAEYDRARLAIVPISTGGGTKIKTIEACAFSRPSVCTTHSARGFGPEIQALLPQGDSPERFTAACLRLLEDGAAADALGATLRTMQQAQFSREAVEAEIARQIGELTGGRTGAG